MSNNIQWLKRTEKYVTENGGADLFLLLEVMYREKKMNFVQFIYDASRGIGCVVSEGLEYVLDQDWDDPEEFDEVSFMLGDYESTTLSPKHFVELMQVISSAYVEEYPNDKKSVENYMAKLKERYSSFN